MCMNCDREQTATVQTWLQGIISPTSELSKGSSDETATLLKQLKIGLGSFQNAYWNNQAFINRAEHEVYAGLKLVRSIEIGWESQVPIICASIFRASGKGLILMARFFWLERPV